MIDRLLTAGLCGNSTLHQAGHVIALLLFNNLKKQHYMAAQSIMLYAI